MATNHDLTREKKLLEDRGFGLRMGFGQRPAVLVVDLLRAFTDPNMTLGSNLDNEVAETNRILDAAHHYNVPVLFSIVQYEEKDSNDAGAWNLKHKGSPTLMAGSPGVEIDPRLHRRVDDLIILKKYASCFFGSDLISRLMARAVDTLIITGCTTSGCVRASAVDALQYGFRPMVVKEAVGDRSAPAHEQSLFDIQIKYGDVVSVDEVLKYFEKTLAGRHNTP
jgi:nicotinamidase-related amidase